MSALRTPPPGFDAGRACALADELERALHALPAAADGIPARKAALMTLRKQLDGTRVAGGLPIVAVETVFGGRFVAYGLACTSVRGFDGALANWIDRARTLAQEAAR